MNGPKNRNEFLLLLDDLAPELNVFILKEVVKRPIPEIAEQVAIYAFVEGLTDPRLEILRAYLKELKTTGMYTFEA